MTATMTYFGWKYRGVVYDLAEPIPVPVGALCLHCEELIGEGEDGFRDAGMNVFHRACFIRMIVGSVAHQKGTCGCDPVSRKWCEEDDEVGSPSGSEEPISKREAARRALAYAIEQKKFQVGTR